MNKLGQAQFFGVLFAVVGFIMAIYLTKSMGASLFWKIITIIACTIAGYMIPTIAGNN